MPHSASCERIFSGLNWFYAKRRQNLSVTTVESMSKIRHFYLTHAYNELQYSGKNYTKEEITNMLKESNLFNEEEDDDDDDDEEEEDEDEEEEEEEDDDDDLEAINRTEIPQNEVYVLIMEKDIDLSLFSDYTEDLSNSKKYKEKNVENSDNDDENFNMNEIITSTFNF